LDASVDDTASKAVRRVDKHVDLPLAAEFSPVHGESSRGNTTHDVVIKTGHQTDAGTTSKVTVQFIGNQGELSFAFDDDVEPHFRRGSIDCASVPAVDIGEPHTCCLQLEMQGDSPSWFVDTVEIVTDDGSTIWEFEQWIESDATACVGRDRILGC
jgi:hypothetical protein